MMIVVWKFVVVVDDDYVGQCVMMLCNLGTCGWMNERMSEWNDDDVQLNSKKKNVPLHIQIEQKKVEKKQLKR